MSKTTNKYSPEVRERAVRMVLDGAGQHESRWAAIVSISSKIGCAPQTLNAWVKRVEVDTGQRGGITTAQAEKMKALEREVRELKQANEILRKGEAIVRHWSEDNGRAHILPPLSSPQAATAAQWDGARPPTETMIRFMEEFDMRPPSVRGPCRTG